MKKYTPLSRSLEILGNNLKKIREERGWNKTKMGRTVFGINPTAYSYIEKGLRPLKPYMLERLYEFHGPSMWRLFVELPEEEDSDHGSQIMFRLLLLPKEERDLVIRTFTPILEHLCDPNHDPEYPH